MVPFLSWLSVMLKCSQINDTCLAVKYVGKLIHVNWFYLNMLRLFKKNFTLNAVS